MLSQSSGKPLSAPIVDLRRLRGAMRDNLISYEAMAHMAGVHPVYLSQMLNGHHKPGQLARLKLAHAAQQLGLEGVVQPGPSETQEADTDS
jgi:transcriptional regulator with XRE-family HTH domain